MPTFDFHCDDCEEVFEELVLGTEEICCPKCDGTKVTRQVSAGSLGVPAYRRHGVDVPASSAAPPSNRCRD